MELLKKLRISAEEPLWLINCPTDCKHLFDGLELKAKTGKEKPVGQLMVFVKNSDELLHYMAKLGPYIGHETLLWIAYPKKSGALQSDLVTMAPWEALHKAGYRPQTSVSINEDWTGLRHTNAPPKKPSTYNIPAEERNVEGIDFVHRTVQLPADALAAVQEHSGLEAYFNALAFSHKKEHVIAITEAKKPETRQRRIEKMVELLLQKMVAKK